MGQPYANIVAEWGGLGKPGRGGGAKLGARAGRAGRQFQHTGQRRPIFPGLRSAGALL